MVTPTEVEVISLQNENARMAKKINILRSALSNLIEATSRFADLTSAEAAKARVKAKREARMALNID